MFDPSMLVYLLVGVNIVADAPLLAIGMAFVTLAAGAVVVWYFLPRRN